MRLSEQDEKELGCLVDDLYDLTRKLRAFKLRTGRLDDFIQTTEYRVLHQRMNELQREVDSLPY